MLLLQIVARHCQMVLHAGLLLKEDLPVSLKCLSGVSFLCRRASRGNARRRDLERRLRIKAPRIAFQRLFRIRACLGEALVIQRLLRETARADRAHQKRLLAGQRPGALHAFGPAPLPEEVTRLRQPRLRGVAVLLRHQPARIDAEARRQIFQRPHRGLRQIVFDLRELIPRDAVARKLLLRQTAFQPYLPYFLAERHGRPSECK